MKITILSAQRLFTRASADERPPVQSALEFICPRVPRGGLRARNPRHDTARTCTNPLSDRSRHLPESEIPRSRSYQVSDGFVQQAL